MKPRLYFTGGHWWCDGKGILAAARTPQEAFRRWTVKSLNRFYSMMGL